MNNQKSQNIRWHSSKVDRDSRKGLISGQGMTIWLTGLSGSGKSTIAVELEKQLVSKGMLSYLLDGDNLRHGLNGDLKFSDSDRKENIRRVAHVASLFSDAGFITIVPLVSPFKESREFAKSLHKEASLNFIEIFVDTPIEVCEKRDSKGLYSLARSGKLKNMTGIDSPYESPEKPDMVFTPEDGSAKKIASTIINNLEL